MPSTDCGAAPTTNDTGHAHGHHDHDHHADHHADRITYTLTGRLSGTLAKSDGTSVTYTNTAFHWRVIGDTTTGTSVLGLAPVPVFEVPAQKDTIKIGDQVLSPIIPTVFATATVPAPEPFGISGFSDVTTNQGLAWQAPALADYDGISAIADLPVTFDNAGLLPTSAGDLTITAAIDLHFSAATF
jgi:hypothetical protein